MGGIARGAENGRIIGQNNAPAAGLICGRPTMTNGDKIRSWDDDQLALWCFCLECADEHGSLMDWVDFLKRECKDGQQ